MRFIDLFAGIGGFHQALSNLGHECVFASEKKEHLAKLYELNYNIVPNRNIRDVNPSEIPDHDILCAGFPCQPFSKAGNMQGLQDENNGSFFDIIIEILQEKNPTYFILENVRNIESHDDFKTWDYISESLIGLGYNISKNVMSPHQYNIPQHRERLFIIGSRLPIDNFEWPPKVELTNTVRNFLHSENAKLVEEDRMDVIDIWQDFINILPTDKSLPGFPIWSMEFGATYPTEVPISELSNEELEKYKGSYGVPLKGLSYEEKIKNLPGYAVKNKGRLVYPDWKIRWINNNRELFIKNKRELVPIVKKLKKLTNKSWQKFEWNCGDVDRNIREHIIQFRASGVRIKKADFFPSLVTVSTQIPIIGWENRYLTPEEGARIQSFENITFPENITTCFGALGNAVNVKLVNLIAANLLPPVEENQVEIYLNQHIELRNAL
ncbi:DNA (cytosine-5-)-methyltransferase [Flavobacterium luteolum]|uniref:DNA (cytosine-5-)-methyltransferase n=1 Tax=Flavobacterium luteolum TaxID=3003259 RepID=UPI00248D88B2|nr:DNA (cytosine-5-)-methyltransferase [Flavobacterium luteolum]